MLGIVVLVLFMAFGAIQALKLFGGRRLIVKIWFGAVMGLMEMMWFPSLYAYLYRFTMTAQVLALLTSAFLAACAFFVPPLGLKESGDPSKAPDLSFLIWLMLPAVAVSTYLQITHSFVEINGELHVAQSTYGDLCMHAGFATGLIGQSYPPEYTLLPGTKLGYPFLVDALSSTMMIFGSSLHVAIFVPGSVMTALLYLGFILFAYELTGSRAAACVAFVLFFFSGGLGFIRLFDNTGLDEMQLYYSLYERYQTPTNLVPENYRWVNALADLIVPQRTLMAGWMCVLPALYMLVSGMRERDAKTFVILGVWAGALPMIHTHSFLALGAVSLGALAFCLIREKERMRTLVLFGVYGLLACALALGQLLEWSFPQTLDGGALKVYFNWVNNDGRGGLIDNYFWFWIKNVGVMYVVIPFAAIFTKNRQVKALAVGALILYALSECVLFQKNEYDNIKLFYVAYLVMLPAGADFAVKAYRLIRGKKTEGAQAAVRKVVSALLAYAFLIAGTLSGAVTLLRECITDDVIFGRAEVAAAEFIRENTPADSVFLTKNNHNNVANTLAGRRIVCGSGIYLYYHGLNYANQERDAKKMLSDPRANAALYEKYSVDYVYVSSYERYANADENYGGADEETLNEMFTLIYEDTQGWETIRIFAVNTPIDLKY